MQIKAKELVGTDVNFVSLVNKGANRVPFRIMKGDTIMLDLNKIGSKLFKKANPVPTVVAVLVNKTAAFESNKKLLEAAGFDLSKSTEDNGVVTFAQKDAGDMSQAKVIKMTDDIGMVAINLEKAFCDYNFEATTFGEIFATEAFYPSMYIATDIMKATVSNIMQKSDNPADAAVAIGKAMDDFKTYVTALASSIPVQAFKFEKSAETDRVTKAAKKPVVETDPEDMADGGADEDKEMEPEDKIKAKGNGNTKKSAVTGADIEGDSAADNSAKNKGPVSGKPKTDLEAQNIEAGDPKVNIANLMKNALAEMMAAVTAKLDKSFADMDSRLEKMSAEVKAASTMAKKAEEAVSGTVIANTPTDKNGVKKSDAVLKSAPPLLDTGFSGGRTN